MPVGELVGEYENKRKVRNVINRLKSTTYNIIENGWKSMKMNLDGVKWLKINRKFCVAPMLDRLDYYVDQ